MQNENILKMIELQTKCITESVSQVKEMLEGCEGMANDNLALAKARKETDIAYKYDHITNDIGSVKRQIDMILRMLEDEKRNERNAMLRLKRKGDE